MNYKKLLVVPGLLFTFLLMASPSFAHVSVKPVQVGVAQYNDFVISVPNEETTPTVQLRLVVPEGLKNVTPNVKPGWNIQVKKSGDGDSATVSEIMWTGGNIPVGQRDQFTFSAQTPSKEAVLVWKAYQTYGDGDTVAWENDPSKIKPAASGEDDHTMPRPYSETKVVNDLAAMPTQAQTSSKSTSDTSQFAMVALALSAAAIAVSLYSLRMGQSKKK